ncbi:MAG: helix-turn-helix domain-containing protein [Pirellulaceae bacterium]
MQLLPHKLLRAAEVAEILACSKSAVYHLKDSGKLPYCKLGGTVRFRCDDVLKFIEDNMVLPTQRHDHPPSPQRLKHLHL